MATSNLTEVWTRGRTGIQERLVPISRITSGWSLLQVRSSRDEAGTASASPTTAVLLRGGSSGDVVHREGADAASVRRLPDDVAAMACPRDMYVVASTPSTRRPAQAQASRNLQEELKPHDAVRQEGADEWNSLLSRASVDDTKLSGKTARGPPGVLYWSISGIDLSSTTRRARRQWTGPLVALPIWRPARHARNG